MSSFLRTDFDFVICERGARVAARALLEVVAARREPPVLRLDPVALARCAGQNGAAQASRKTDESPGDVILKVVQLQ